MTKGNVTVAGAVIADTVVRPVDQDRWGTTTFVESITRCVGGNAANTSLALAKLGVLARVLGAVGQDAEGEFLRGQLAEAGVDVSGLHTVHEPTAQTIVLVNSEGNRKFLHRMGAGAVAFREPVAFEHAGGRGAISTWPVFSSSRICEVVAQPCWQRLAPPGGPPRSIRIGTRGDAGCRTSLRCCPPRLPLHERRRGPHGDRV